MLNWLFGKDLNAYLSETKKIKVSGVRFTIKKIDVLDHLDGSKVMLQNYETYKTKGAVAADSASEKKLREHVSQVLVCGVVNPKLSHKNDGSGVFVETLFVDWDMCLELYQRIYEFTYGKKKL